MPDPGGEVQLQDSPDQIQTDVTDINADDGIHVAEVNGGGASDPEPTDPATAPPAASKTSTGTAPRASAPSPVAAAAAAPTLSVTNFFNLTLMEAYKNATADNSSIIRVPLADPYPDPPSSFDISIKSGANARLAPERLRDARDLRVMPLLTIVSVPKAFEGLTAKVQTSAITSWTKMVPPPQIVLLGDAPGAAQAAATLPHVEHYGSVPANRRSVPLLDGVLSKAERVALAPTVLFVACDTMLTDEVVTAMMRVQAKHRRFLILGRRAELPRLIDAQSETWLSALDASVVSAARVPPDPQPLEFFIFSRGLFASNGAAGRADRVPPLAVAGRLVDNWVINYTRSVPDAAIVDASNVVLPVRLVPQGSESSSAPAGQPPQKSQQQAKSASKPSLRKRTLDLVSAADPDSLENANVIRRLAGLSPLSAMSAGEWKRIASLLRFSGLDSAQWTLYHNEASPLHLSLNRTKF